MSDKRREIAARLIFELYHTDPLVYCTSGVREVEKCMSEYAAALLEEMASDAVGRIMKIAMRRDRQVLIQFAEDLRARAAQEREQ